MQGCDLIIHAGDVGKPEILDVLKELAPVVAVRGNVDTQPWTSSLPENAVVETGAVTIYVLHNLDHLDLDLAAGGFGVIVSGHSHKPSQQERGGVIYINPGSAGPRRFSLPVTVARLDLTRKPLQTQFINLAISST